MAENAGNRGLFCDLAGTLVRMDDTRQLPVGADRRITVDLLPGVAEKLMPMRDHLIFVVTNQAGIARGRITLEQVEAAIAELDRRLGGILTAWQICPHNEGDGCPCRKPKGAMLTELGAAYGVEMAESTMVGDQEIDAEAARSAGVGRFVWASEFFGWD
jgi:histidinol-phosphate phosphatase family protein